MKKSDLERRTDASTCKMMPPGFVPGPYEILIGRGRRCTMHWGNQRFRRMIAMELEGYAAADCKRHKSSIIGRVLADIKKHSPEAGIIKKDVATGRWLSFTDAASRVAIAQAFRDALDDSYKSSKHSKQIKRRMDKNTGMPYSDSPAFAQTQPVPPLHNTLADNHQNEELRTMDTSIDDFTSVRAYTESEMMDNDEFAALFLAFARVDVDTEDNPYEPLPLADSSTGAIGVGESVVTPLMSPLPSIRHPLYFKNSIPSSLPNAFGSTPFRDVRAAKTA